MVKNNFRTFNDYFKIESNNVIFEEAKEAVRQ